MKKNQSFATHMAWAYVNVTDINPDDLDIIVAYWVIYHLVELPFTLVRNHIIYIDFYGLLENFLNILMT